MNIVVLLSSHNGEKYIREQIDSILSQKGADVSLLVRDDGSEDSTVDILRSYGDGLSFYEGSNIGIRASFFDLIQKAPKADFYAFSDQDDLWLEDKLMRAVGLIRDAKGSALCFSNMYVASEDLSSKKASHIRFRPTPGAAMAQNPAAGASMAFNRAFLELLRLEKNPDEISMHDTFAYRVAMFTDSFVAFDEIPSYLYRQHSSNSIGSRISAAEKLGHYISFFLSGRHFSRPKEAELILSAYYSYISDENKALLRDIISYRDSFFSGIRLILSGRLRTHSIFLDILTAAAILCRRF